MATIQDVARLARVSVSSVSNVLNRKRDRMRAETYARIEDAIRKLDYRPSQAARQLKTGRIPILGLLVPTTANPFFGQLSVAMESYARDRYGHRILLCNTNRDQAHEAAIFDDLLSLGINAVVVASSLSDERHIDAAMRRGLAVVSFDVGQVPGMAMSHDHVLPDNELAGRMAAEHLIEHGHQRLAFVTPHGWTYSRRCKVEGFQAAVQAAGPPVSGEVVESRAGTRFGDTELASLGYDVASTLLRKRRRPTGVVTVNDMIALGLMAGVRAHGLSVPDDLSVVGMDDLAISAYSCPPLTSVRMPITDMAHSLVDRAILRTERSDLAPEEFRHMPVLTRRRSVSAPPARRKRAASLED